MAKRANGVRPSSRSDFQLVLEMPKVSADEDHKAVKKAGRVGLPYAGHSGDSTLQGGRAMALYELRAYTLRVGTMAEAVKLYQEIGFPALQKGSHDKKLVGYFQADTGTIKPASASVEVR